MTEELEEFLKLMHKVLDIGIVIELNVLSDWIFKLKDRRKLKERLQIIKELKLEKGCKKLHMLISRR